MLAEALLGTLDGVRVVSAGTAAEALALHRRHQPAVMLLDFQLPDGTASTVLAALREDGPHTTRTVLFSASQHQLEDRSIAAVLPKPFLADDLLRTVRELLP